MHYYAYALQRAFSILDRTPRFVIMIISGAVASLAMRLLHKPPPSGPAQAQPKPAVTEKVATESVASSTAVQSNASSSPSKSKGKSRKGGKK